MIKRGATVGTLTGQGVPYLVLGNQWVSYDTPQSYRTKVGLLNETIGEIEHVVMICRSNSHVVTFSPIN